MGLPPLSLKKDDERVLGKLSFRIDASGGDLLGPDSWVKTYTVMLPVTRDILEAGKVARLIASKPIEHFQAALEGANAYALGDIERLETTLGTEKLDQQRREGSRRLKEIEAAKQKLAEDYAQSEETQGNTGVQTRAGSTTGDRRTGVSREEAEAKYSVLQEEADKVEGRLKELEAESNRISPANWLLFEALDLVVGATKDDPRNILRQARLHYKNEMAREGKIPTGHGLLIELNRRTGAHRAELCDEADRMLRSEHAHWDEVMKSPRRLAERIEELLHVNEVLHVGRDTVPIQPAANFARRMLSSTYASDVTYQPFLQTFIEDTSVSLEELAEQITDKCNKLPLLFDTDRGTAAVSAFVAPAAKPNARSRRNRNAGGNGMQSIYPEGETTGCRHCGELTHYVKNCELAKAVKALREKRTQSQK